MIGSIMFRGCLLALAMVFALPAYCSETVLDIGSTETDAALGYGWRNRNERHGTNTFRWIVGLEADMTVEIERVKDLDIEIFARPFYWDNCTQRFALFVNNEYVDEWTCETHPEWFFDRYETAIPDSLLVKGLNRFTFRTGYASGDASGAVSLAIDRIILSERDRDDKLNGSNLRLVAQVAIAIAVTGVGVLILKRRLKK